MVELFGIDKSGISRCIKYIFETAIIRIALNCCNFAAVQSEASRVVNRSLDFYNLDVIIFFEFAIRELQIKHRFCILSLISSKIMKSRVAI